MPLDYSRAPNNTGKPSRGYPSRRDEPVDAYSRRPVESRARERVADGPLSALLIRNRGAQEYPAKSGNTPSSNAQYQPRSVRGNNAEDSAYGSNRFHGNQSYGNSGQHKQGTENYGSQSGNNSYGSYGNEGASHSGNSAYGSYGISDQRQQNSGAESHHQDQRSQHHGSYGIDNRQNRSQASRGYQSNERNLAYGSYNAPAQLGNLSYGGFESANERQSHNQYQGNSYASNFNGSGAYPSTRPSHSDYGGSGINNQSGNYSARNSSREYQPQNGRDSRPSYQGRPDYHDQRDSRGQHPRNQRGSRDNRPRDRGPRNQNRHDNDRVARKPAPRLLQAEASARLEKLRAEGVVPLTGVQVLGSRWGVRPSGFDKVSAQRAKLSGLFPLPGHPRPVDFTKLEGLVKDGSSGASDILVDASRIDACDSRTARTLIITGANFAEIDYLKIVQYWNDYLRRIDVADASMGENVTDKRKTKDDKTLLVEFKSSMLATIVYCMRETPFQFNAFKKDTAAPHESNEDSFILTIERPLEYVVAHNSAGQIACHVLPDTTDTMLSDAVKGVAPDSLVKIIREAGTQKSLGLALIDCADGPDSTRLRLIEDLELVKKCFFSCFPSPHTSIQSCLADYDTLPKMARNEQVSAHPRLRVAVLLNIVSVQELMDDEAFQFIHSDITHEAKRFGQVLMVKIPRPAHNYCPGLQQFAEPGLGKVYIKFSEESMAMDAIMDFAGRLYNDRTVLCAFHSERDFDLGLL